MVYQSLIIAILLCWAIYEGINHGKAKQQVLAGNTSKTTLYQQTILCLWLPTLVLIAYLAFGDLTLQQIGLINEPSLMRIGLGIAGVILVSIYCYVALDRVNRTPEQHDEIRQSFAELHWMMPVSRSERNWFVGPVAWSAGVCEELLFRGFLIYFLDTYLGLIGAVVLSSVAFGLMHFYQGVFNVVRTALIG